MYEREPKEFRFSSNLRPLSPEVRHNALINVTFDTQDMLTLARANLSLIGEKSYDIATETKFELI